MRSINLQFSESSERSSSYLETTQTSSHFKLPKTLLALCSCSYMMFLTLLYDVPYHSRGRLEAQKTLTNFPLTELRKTASCNCELSVAFFRNISLGVK